MLKLWRSVHLCFCNCHLLVKLSTFLLFKLWRGNCHLLTCPFCCRLLPSSPAESIELPRPESLCPWKAILKKSNSSWKLISRKSYLDDNHERGGKYMVVLCVLLQGYWENPNLGLMMLCSQITDICHISQQKVKSIPLAGCHQTLKLLSTTVGSRVVFW